MQSIDLTATPAEYATVARHVITAAYGLQIDHLSDDQVLWAWAATEPAADRIGTPVQDLPLQLGTELLRMYTARARTINSRPVATDTPCEQLNTPATATMPGR